MKILFALHEHTMNPTNLDFACYIARATHGRLTGIIMETMEHESIYVSDSPESKGFRHVMESTDMPDNAVVRRQTVALAERFHEACISRDVTPLIHKDRGLPFEELVLETRFADLLLLDARTDYPAPAPGAPSNFVKHMLAESQCPVLVLPEGRHEIQELIFTYDGQASSMHAIKQFSYLFPQWRHLPAVVVQAEERTGDITYKHNLQEWMNERYTSVRYEFHERPASGVLMEHAFGRSNSMVVMGAYGRKGLSALVKRSEGDALLKITNQPTFISHH